MHGLPYHRSSAWPLAWAFVGLIVYASLHPFSGWQMERLFDANFLRLPWPFYNQRWDIASNYVAYIPLGLLACTAWRRDGAGPLAAALATCVLGSALSYSMEVTQHLLPTRVPSLLDWLLNTAGTVTGAALALLLHSLQWVEALRRLRNRWVLPHQGNGQTLLLLWPLALLFPPPVPLGLGQVLDRLTEMAIDLLADTPYADWVQERYDLDTLSPGAEMLVVGLGLLAPVVMACALTRSTTARLVMLLGAALLGTAATALSTALNFGPEHAWSWITPPVIPGLVLGLLLGLPAVWLPRKVTLGIGLMSLTALVGLVNQAPSDPYYALSLHAWEQGRFIRFHGLAQWIGWVWPYLAAAWMLAQLSRRDPGYATRSS